MSGQVWKVNRFESLQDVCDAAPPGTTIMLPEGDFRQKLIIRTPGLTLVGAGMGQTRILFDDYALKLDSVNVPLGTFRSFTVAVTAFQVTLCNLSVVNDAGDPVRKGQQVALSVYGDAFHMKDCSVISTQDTVFLGPLPSDLLIRYRDLLPRDLCCEKSVHAFFGHCLIAGSVDFVFGGGEAVFDRCTIRSVSDGHRSGFVAAPSHAFSQKKGFQFTGCVFTAEEGIQPGTVFLARPWRDYGMCVFEDCIYGKHIAPVGFDPWGTSGRSATARFCEKPLLQGRAEWAIPG